MNLENMKQQFWSEYYNSSKYSVYIFNEDFIFFDDVINNKQLIIEFDEKIYDFINNYNLTLCNHREPENFTDLITNFENVSSYYYKFDKVFK
ncbi:hypothetical protein CRU96_12750 [Malaciobacter halophilus]|nr:hypothetical protein [Malaciobacter halophilus]RYA22487.1 hypothetical protein CRU96_12750 [Malaciobacter halophilus]